MNSDIFSLVCLTVAGKTNDPNIFSKPGHFKFVLYTFLQDTD